MFENIPHKFHAIYLIHSITGTELISKNFTANGFDVDIISGMFKALEIFINQLAYSQSFERLEEINFGNLSVIYERFGNGINTILCVGICGRDFHQEYSHAILKRLVRDFYYQFEMNIANYKGSVNKFQAFLPILNELDRRNQTISSFESLPSNIINPQSNHLN
jgi:hypothetical protein